MIERLAQHQVGVDLVHAGELELTLRGRRRR